MTRLPVVVRTIDEYSFILKGRKIKVCEGEYFVEIARPNSRWVLVSRSSDSVQFFLPRRILVQDEAQNMDTSEVDVKCTSTAAAHVRSSVVSEANSDSFPSPPLESILCTDPVASTCSSPSKGSNSSLASSELTIPHDDKIIEKPNPITSAINPSSAPPPDAVPHTEKIAPELMQPDFVGSQKRSSDPDSHLNFLTSPSFPTPPPDHLNFSSDQDSISAGSDMVEAGIRSSVDSSMASMNHISASEHGEKQSPSTETNLSSLPDSSQKSTLSEVKETASEHGVTQRLRWQRIKTDDDEHYLHPTTGEMWFRTRDSHGQVYYYDAESRRSVWSLRELDPNTSLDEISSDESAIPETNTTADRSKHEPTPKQISRTSSGASERFDLMELRQHKESASVDPKLLHFERRDVVHWTQFMKGCSRKSEHWSKAIIVLSGSYLLLYKNAKATVRKSNQPYGKYILKCPMPNVVISDASEAETTKRDVLKFELVPGGTSAFLVKFNSKSIDGWRAALHSAKKLLNEGQVHSRFVQSTPQVSKLDTGLLAKLRELFSRRPSPETLRSRGILKNESVFASSLVQICENESTDVPKFVTNAIQAIEARGLEHEGIYRIAGSTSMIQKLRCAVDQDKYSLDDKKWPLEVLTGSLKLFFRELKEPLFTYDLFSKITALQARKLPDNDLLPTYCALMKTIPTPHLNTAIVLFKHLKKVMQLSNVNQMNPSNLATVFGPTLMRPDEESGSWGALSVQVTFVYFCLEHVDELFP